MPIRPRLRDAGRLSTHDLYPLNIFPDELIRKLGGYLVYLIYIGRKGRLRSASSFYGQPEDNGSRAVFLYFRSTF